MPGVVNPEMIAKVLPAVMRLPTVVTWNRLEGRPRSVDFSRSLRVEVRDALWMLARQWQLGEFVHEDRGSAVFARLHTETTRITRYAQEGGPAVAFDENPPLETRVEREAVPFDVVSRLEWGRRWLGLLTHHGASAATVDFFRAAFPMPAVPAPDVGTAQAWSNRPAIQWSMAAAGRGLDGGALLETLGGTAAADIEHAGGTAPDPGPTAAAEADLLAAFGRLYSLPTEREPENWDPARLEYRFACSAPEADGSQTVLTSEEYADGHLDWYAFDVESDPAAALIEHPDEVVNDAVRGEETLTMLPASLEFGGMPSPRWWEFEDRRTNLGDIDANTTELAKLLLAQFTLLYSNDWMVVPYELPVGSLTRVSGLVVVDTFGQRHVIRPAGRGADEDWQRWSMYNLSNSETRGPADHRLFLPPVLGKLAESPPVGEVRLFRDEMANMVWGVEVRIPDDLGGGRQGFEAAADLVALLEELAPDVAPPSPPVETGAPVKYIAGTTVPENWIPFIPVHVPGSNRQVQLQRAAMPRLIAGLPPVDVAPRGEVLRPFVADAYFIFEEELGKAGLVVTRSYQRSRGVGGETYLWLGRRTRIGRDSRASGLRFDQIDEQFPED